MRKGHQKKNGLPKRASTRLPSHKRGVRFPPDDETLPRVARNKQLVAPPMEVITPSKRPKITMPQK